MVAAAVAGGSALISGATSLIGSSEAADAQQHAADQANATQQGMFNQTQKNLSPYMELGSQATASLGSLTGVGGTNPLSSPLLSGVPLPPNMTEDQLVKTPGYKFNLSQGLESVQNAAAARGLGNSGAAFKGAATFATGLADSTYQNQFNNYQQQFNNQVTNQTNQFNRLLSLSGQGENAAAGLGNVGQQTAANIGNNLVGAGNAQGASYIAGANGVSNALSGGLNSYALMNYINGVGSKVNPMSGGS